MFGAHHEVLSSQVKNLYFAESKMDYETDKKPQASGGLQNLIHIDVYHRYFEDGPDSTLGPCEGNLDLESSGRWSLYGFSSYVLQCVRGLAEGPVGRYYQHREGVRYIHGFYMDIMMGDQYKHTAIFYPKYFPKVRMGSKPRYEMEDMMRVPHYHKEGGCLLELCSQRHRMFYIYICCIFGMIVPSYMTQDETPFRILRNKFIRTFHDAHPPQQRRYFVGV